MHSISQWIAGLLMAACLLSWSHPANAEATRCIAVFNFELMDLSLDGQMNGARPEQANRLQLLTVQLQDWINANTNGKACNMDRVQAEASASNLSACGCVPRLAKSVGAGLAVVSSVHKLSNLILNIRVDIFDVETNALLAQLNADIRSNTDSSWQRGLNWLIEHRLAGAFTALESRAK